MQRAPLFILFSLLPTIALAVLARGAPSPPVISAECGAGGVLFPPGNPWASSMNCSGTCEEGTCELAGTPSGTPGTYLAYCSCDASAMPPPEPTCCHLIATAVAGGSVTFHSEGECGGDCPGEGGSTCSTAAIQVVVDGVPTTVGYVPSCS
jgi:hypothetical protein